MIDSLDNSFEFSYNFLDPIMHSDFLDDQLFKDLIKTTAFRRLHHIRFLGAIDYFLVSSPNGIERNRRYTRFQHSLGVARLAFLYSHIKGLSQKYRRLACVAALLHDIGHSPFSHTMEPIFEDKFGFNHHFAAKLILTGSIGIGIELRDILDMHKVDIEELIAIIQGGEDPFDGFFSGPINFDTVEGILRSKMYIKGNSMILSPIEVVKAAIFRSNLRDRDAVDNFWRHKHEVYKHIIRSGFGVSVDYAFQNAMRTAWNNIDRYDFFSTEKRIFRKIPELRRIVRNGLRKSAENRSNTVKIPYKIRDFYVNDQGSFFARDDRNRYRQSKRDGVLAVQPLKAMVL
ncbi:MAG: HD domain-containing protein [Methylacidiphilales bacterium]|nr:HD domain-containing protein [Candidatus Methylacidiphilales bacterium]